MRSFILTHDQPVSNTNRHECIRIGERTRLGCGRSRPRDRELSGKGIREECCGEGTATRARVRALSQSCSRLVRRRTDSSCGELRRGVPYCVLGTATERRGYSDFWLIARSSSKNDMPCDASRSSSFFVQSQSQHAQGSVPFSCRQVRRECASFTLSSSKYSSQYGRSSASGGSQKQVSTQVATP